MTPQASQSVAKKPLVRFAPSPTGRLHVGNMRTALINYLFARAGAGAFMLRFDDTDTARNKDEFYHAIRADLAWMGIVWDETHEIRQSTRTKQYQTALNALIKAGRAYPCFESQDELGLMRKTQLAQGHPPRYNRAALKLTETDIKARIDKGDQPYYRFLLDDAETAWDDLVRGKQSVKMTSLSDPVIRRADGRFIYTLASVVDDVEFATTHILRGEDHTTNSAAQLQIFAGLGATPPAMGHFPLLLGKSGEGLSKRLGSLTIASLRDEAGWEAETIASLLVRLGTGEAVVVADSVAALAEGFDVKAFGRAPPRFDEGLLAGLNMQRLARMEYATAKARLAETGGAGKAGEALDEAVWEAVKANCGTLNEAMDWQANLTMPLATEAIANTKLRVAAETHLPKDTLTRDTWQAWTKAVITDTGLAKKEVYQALRHALTNKKHGPEMAKLVPILGRTRIIARLHGKDASGVKQKQGAVA